MYGDGKQTRSFAYVSDLVDGLTALMESNYTQPVNLGNPEEHTIIDFARIIKGVIGEHSPSFGRSDIFSLNSFWY